MSAGADRGLVVLVSGRGSNLRAILESGVGPRVRLVVSDNPAARGLAVAGEFGVPATVVAWRARAEFERAALRHIGVHRPCLVALAGFMRVLSAGFLARLEGWVVNIHPSLLPRFPGLDTHRRALESGAREHGCTVHWVDERLDGGTVLAQASVAVRPGDDERALAARVLEAEHRLYPATIARVLCGAARPGEALRDA